MIADEAYGQVGRLRLWLEDHDLAHMLAVPNRRWSSPWTCERVAPTPSLPRYRVQIRTDH
jgi:hypothetical protein